MPIIFLNLFIAVILNGFTNSSEEEGFEVFKILVENFKKIWQRFDQDATGFIDVSQMSKFISMIDKETDFISQSLNDNPKFINSYISQLQLPVYLKFQKYYFQDALILISKKFICHKYVLENLKLMPLQDDVEVIRQEKFNREHEFEEQIDDIQVKAVQDKIQLI